MGFLKRASGSKKALLFEKRSKNFCSLATRWGNANALFAKVFWFFFTKKNCLLPCAVVTPKDLRSLNLGDARIVQ
jgi:hypothetical protein